MAFFFFRSFLLALGINALFFLWVLLGFNHGKGLFFFTVDEAGLMFLLPFAVAGNLGLWLIFYGLNKWLLLKAFGYLLLLLIGGCTAIWAHGCASGVTL